MKNNEFLHMYIIRGNVKVDIQLGQDVLLQSSNAVTDMKRSGMEVRLGSF